MWYVDYWLFANSILCCAPLSSIARLQTFYAGATFRLSLWWWPPCCPLSAARCPLSAFRLGLVPPAHRSTPSCLCALKLSNLASLVFVFGLWPSAASSALGFLGSIVTPSSAFFQPR